MLCWLETHRQFPGLFGVVSCCSWASSPSSISTGVLHCICDEAKASTSNINNTATVAGKIIGLLRQKLQNILPFGHDFRAQTGISAFKQNRDPLSVRSGTEVCPRLSPLQERRADL